VVAESAVVEARPSVVFPVTESVPVISALPEVERLVVEALVNVVLPVTFKVDEKFPVVPDIAPRLAVVEKRLVAVKAVEEPVVITAEVA
jgi:hypothetical protein